MKLVVTGATDGIGKEYAKQLAKRGINIVLIARNESKLIDVSKEIGMNTHQKRNTKSHLNVQNTLHICSNLLIESLYAVQTKYIVVDFGDGREVFDRIEQQLQELSVPIGILGKNFVHQARWKWAAIIFSNFVLYFTNCSKQCRHFL